MGLDNSGYLVFDVDIEMEPKTYNTSNSKLWTKVRRVFKDELAKMYRDMRASTFKEENLFNILIGEQIDKIPESLYNEDSERKYIKNPKYLHMLHGSRREHMRKWIRERLLYLDSQFGYEKNTSESIIIRANKKGRVELKIKTYSPMFVKVRWRNDSTSTELKKVGRNQIVSFVGDLPTETDQEIAIYGAKHIKEIGDISHMTPSSLTLGNAIRLTKIECRNSPNLKAIGLGGSASEDGSRLKNLQLIDLTGCSKLGQDTSSADLNVSYCDNLKTLKLHGTNLQSVTFNTEGGNLEEMYLPYSITSLYLNGQYNLKKVEFPDSLQTFSHRTAYNNGSKITSLTVINCPNIISFGVSIHHSYLNSGRLYNYRWEKWQQQDPNFDISINDYKKTFQAACLSRLENVTITNSFSQHKYLCINVSTSLKTVKLNDMPNLKGLILAGNRLYGPTGGSVQDNFEGKQPAFENIFVNNACTNFDTLLIQTSYDWGNFAYKFKENFEWDLSHLPLKRFICTMALQNLKKIILPDTIEEFSHTTTALVSYNQTASDGSSCQYTEAMSPLETIVIKGRHEEEFKGIDFVDIPLTNANFNGLTQKVETIRNINCHPTDLSPAVGKGKILENIKVDLNNFYGKSLKSMYASADDITKINVTLDKQLTAENMDYSYMFNNAKNVKWENIKDFIAKLPPGNMYYTFQHCDADRLEVGKMIGSATTYLGYCFTNMPNVTEIDVTGANTENVQDYDCAFYNNRKLKRIPGAEYLVQSNNCTSIRMMLRDTQQLKLDFVDNKLNWKIKPNTNTARCFYRTGTDIVLEDNEEYVLDLSDYNRIYAQGEPFAIQGTGFTKIILDNCYFDVYAYNWDPTIEILENPNLKELIMTNCDIERHRALGYNCPNLINVDLSNTTAERATQIWDNCQYFYKATSLKDVKFMKNLGYPVNVSTLNNLSVDSLVSILNGLKSPIDNNNKVIQLGETNLKKLNDNQKDIAISKGWSLV